MNKERMKYVSAGEFLSNLLCLLTFGSLITSIACFFLAMFSVVGWFSVALSFGLSVFFFVCFGVMNSNVEKAKGMTDDQYEKLRHERATSYRRYQDRPRKRRHSTFLILGGLAWLISDILKDSKRYGRRKTDYMPGITKDRYH